MSTVPRFIASRRNTAVRLAALGLLSVPLAAAACSNTSMKDMALSEAPEYYRAAGEEMSDAAQGQSAAGLDQEAEEPYAEGSVDASASASGASRKLVFTAYMRLTVEDVRAAVKEASRFVEARGGFVESAGIEGSPDWEQAEVTLRVPQESYEAAREHLRSGAVEVVSEESSRSDVTGTYVDLEARLENLRAAEQELREILGEARETGGTTEDVLAIHRELTRVRGDIEGLQAQLDALEDQVALSTIVASFRSVPATPADVVGAWRPGSVLRDAQSDLAGALKGLANAGIYLTVAVLPILVIFGLVVAAVVVVLRAVLRRVRRS